MLRENVKKKEEWSLKKNNISDQLVNGNKLIHPAGSAPAKIFGLPNMKK